MKRAANRNWLTLLLLAALALPGLRTHAETLTVQDLVNRLEKRFQSVNEYEVVMEGEFHGKKDHSRGTYHIWRRCPDRFRLRVEQGDHRGSEIAFADRGGVRARPGGILKKVVSTSMSRDDQRLRSPRGKYPWESCPERQVQVLNERVKLSKNAQVRPDAGNHRVEVEMNYREPAQGTAMREIWTVDTQNWYVVAQDVFEDGRLVERVRYRDFRPNPGLKDSDFTF